MALDTVPWMVAGGAIHSAEVGRALAYVASNGNSGVSQTNDLLVRALATPGTAVRVAPGSASIVNTYAGQSGQSYIARNTSDENIGITQTGAQARSDMLVLRIDDPQYGGTAPSDAENGPYVRFAIIPNVGATATKIPDGTPYPAIPLARIDIPANTGTIQASYIKDLRVGLDKMRTGRITIQAPGNTTQTDYPVVFTPAFPDGALPRFIVSGTGNNVDWLVVDGGVAADSKRGYVRVKNTFQGALPATVDYIAIVQ